MAIPMPVDESLETRDEAAQALSVIMSFAHSCVLDDDIWAAAWEKIKAEYEEAHPGEPADGDMIRQRLHALIDAENFSLMIARAMMAGVQQGPPMRRMPRMQLFAMRPPGPEPEPERDDGERPRTAGPYL